MHSLALGPRIHRGARLFPGACPPAPPAVMMQMPRPLRLLTAAHVRGSDVGGEKHLLGSFQLGQQQAVQQLGMKAFNFYYGKSVKIK